MDSDQYLRDVLANQDLAEDSEDLKQLRDHRGEVEKLLRNSFPKSTPIIRYGGSYAKGTLIKESFDLDVICYFPSDDTDAGGSLKDIYENVSTALARQYSVQQKTSALRIQSKDKVDFHIDVVPGKFVDGGKGDAFLYQASADKARLKSNLDVHLAHVKDSGVIAAIRLLKLWKTRKALRVKQFVFELLIIKLLERRKSASPSEQLGYVLAQLRDATQPMKVEDPANPSGNDLSGLLSSDIWSELAANATITLTAVLNQGWEMVFGAIENMSSDERLAALQIAAGAVSRPTKPWCPGR